MDREENEKIKDETRELEKKLKLKGKLSWDRMEEREKEETFRFAEGYKAFLNSAKTEREAVQEIAGAAKEAGFQEGAQGGGGKKFFYLNKDKAIALAMLGSAPIAEGVRIVISHIDSPRIDLKQNPLYEEADMALLHTHYYGGIKKYHVELLAELPDTSVQETIQLCWPPELVVRGKLVFVPF